MAAKDTVFEIVLPEVAKVKMMGLDDDWTVGKDLVNFGEGVWRIKAKVSSNTEYKYKIFATKDGPAEWELTSNRNPLEIGKKNIDVFNQPSESTTKDITDEDIKENGDKNRADDNKKSDEKSDRRKKPEEQNPKDEREIRREKARIEREERWKKEREEREKKTKGA